MSYTGYTCVNDIHYRREEGDEEKELDEEEAESSSALTMETGDNSRDGEPNLEPPSDPPPLGEPEVQGDTFTAATDPSGETPAVATATIAAITGAVPGPEDSESKQEWPSIGDLNSRLRRVITSYQKNFRKEEIKQLQKARVIFSMMHSKIFWNSLRLAAHLLLLSCK